ncbi:NAD(P)H-dependent oxidoreductase [Plantactinospora sp. ZYX-F-223]|uniref:NADPH-dependent FMN reductase n=1 Tax=Plantactinospora sp. ZYX-F-223 TaxID=3144103 RepID=UPI0031FDFA52
MTEPERSRTVPAPELSLAVIVGSVRRPRVGRIVADWFAETARQREGLAVDLVDLAEVALPLDGTPPGGNPNSPISGRLASADGFVVVTPEYNHSFPAALKNAIDWHYREWMFKPVALVSYGAGSGGIRAAEQLRLVFAELYAATTRNCVALTAPWSLVGRDGVLTVDAPTRQAADTTLDELTWWASTLRSGRLDNPYPG